MWISRTHDAFHPGFPVKTSLPGLDFSVPFINQSHVLHGGGIFFALAQWKPG